MGESPKQSPESELNSAPEVLSLPTEPLQSASKNGIKSEPSGWRAIRIGLWWGAVLAAIITIAAGYGVLTKGAIVALCACLVILADLAIFEHGWADSFLAKLYLLGPVAFSVIIALVVWPPSPDHDKPKQDIVAANKTNTAQKTADAAREGAGERGVKDAPKSPPPNSQQRHIPTATAPPQVQPQAAGPPKINQDATPRRQAIVLSDEVMKWMGDVRTDFPDLDEAVIEYYKEYPTKFREKLWSIDAALKRCGADTSKLDNTLSALDRSYHAINHLDAIFFELRNAAYDIPGGQTECGSGPIAPGFHIKDNGVYYLTTGGSTIGLNEEQLKHPMSPGTFWDIHPFEAYLLNGHFYVDATLYGPSGMFQTVVVKRNELTAQYPGLDSNFTKDALEVVDHGVPILQMIFENERKVSINGLFAGPDGKHAVLITPSGNTKVDLQPFGEKKIVVPLKPIFKYPAWQYRGIYADK